MTAFNDVVQAFYHYIENDVDFFEYFELDEEQSMAVAKQRAMVLLGEAISYIKRKLIIENVFSKVEEVVEDGEGEVITYMAFTETLTDVEINLLVKAMFLMYLNRDITVLRTFHGVMTSSDLNMYSPANERKTFMAMVQQYEENLKIEISEYSMLDRETGQYIQICE